MAKVKHNCIECHHPECEGECGCRCGWLPPRHFSAQVQAKREVLERAAQFAQDSPLDIYSHAKAYCEKMRAWELLELEAFKREGKVQRVEPSKAVKRGSSNSTGRSAGVMPAGIFKRSMD